MHPAFLYQLMMCMSDADHLSKVQPDLVSLVPPGLLVTDGGLFHALASYKA
jgi:hypothetical protein